MRFMQSIVGGLVVVGLIGSWLLPAGHAGDQTSAAQVKKEVGEAIESLKAYSADRRDEAVAKARAAVERLDRHIARMEDRMHSQWERMDQAARERQRATLRELRKQRTELAEWSGRLRESSAGAWSHVKQGFVESYRALADAFSKAEAEFTN